MAKLFDLEMRWSINAASVIFGPLGKRCFLTLLLSMFEWFSYFQKKFKDPTLTAPTFRHYLWRCYSNSVAINVT